MEHIRQFPSMPSGAERRLMRLCLALVNASISVEMLGQPRVRIRLSQPVRLIRGPVYWANHVYEPLVDPQESDYDARSISNNSTNFTIETNGYKARFDGALHIPAFLRWSAKRSFVRPGCRWEESSNYRTGTIWSES